MLEGQPSFPARDDLQVFVTDSRFSEYETVVRLNRLIFQEDRIINSFEHPVMLTIIAKSDDEPVGFKLGYNLNDLDFYSAKGGVLPPFRKKGVARKMLHLMMETAKRRGFERFKYDTFPNLYPAMLILGLKEGFQVESIEWNARYGDWQMRLIRKL